MDKNSEKFIEENITKHDVILSIVVLILAFWKSLELAVWLGKYLATNIRILFQ